MGKRGRFVAGAVCALLAVNLVIVMTCAPILDYDSKTNLVQLDPIFLLVAAGLGTLVCVGVAAFVRTRAWERLVCLRSFAIVLSVTMVLLVAAQAVMFWGAFFRTGWDLIYVAGLDVLEQNRSYFETYPNQRLLVGLFELVAAPMRADGTYTLMGCYERVAVIACASVDISIVAMALAARKVGGYAIGYATLALMVLMCGLSPWVMVPYTDALGMLCPSLVLASYACVKRPRLRAALVGAFGAFGYFVKPTAIFVVVAILVAELLRGKLAQRLRSAGVVGVGTTVLAFVLAAGIGVGTAQALSSRTLELDPQRAFSATHYLMMGANEADGGGYSGTDVRLSWSYPTQSERKSAELDEWKRRLGQMGPAGTIRLFARKICTNFADGTLAWRKEGDFFMEVTGASDAIRWWLGVEPNYTTVPPYSFVAQPLWLLVLLGCIACALVRRPDPVTVAMLLSVAMLSVFLAIFECRARYLYLYLPYFCLLACLGWREVGALVVGSGRESHPHPLSDAKRGGTHARD